MRHTQLFIDGRWCDGEAGRQAVEDKFRGEPVATLETASPAQAQHAVGALDAAHREHVIAPYERHRILTGASRRLDERRAEFLDVIVQESGFTVGDAKGEIDRAIQTLRLSGEEATRLSGEMIPLDGAPGVRDRIGFTRRFPVGVVCAITPFNSPLNTVAHKVGPALAAGNAVVLKPATYTPVTASLLVEVLLESGLPGSHIALLHGGGRDVGSALLEDERIAFYTFTGSTEVGRVIRRTIGLRRAQLELGSLSSTIICDDADLEVAISRSAAAAFRKAGQVCTSVQRLYVDRRVIDEFAEGLRARVKDLPVGDPRAEDTFVGPLISEADAVRVADWVSEAVRAGARTLTGGERTDRVVTPSVLVDVDMRMQVMCQEVFGPVVSLRPFDDLDQAVAEANDTPYGLAAGVFTRDIGRAMHASERLHVGSVHINQTSSSRIDLMPYGGVKDSGSGHEGPAYAAREMTEERLITITYG